MNRLFQCDQSVSRQISNISLLRPSCYARIKSQDARLLCYPYHYHHQSRVRFSLEDTVRRLHPKASLLDYHGTKIIDQTSNVTVSDSCTDIKRAAVPEQRSASLHQLLFSSSTFSLFSPSSLSHTLSLSLSLIQTPSEIKAASSPLLLPFSPISLFPSPSLSPIHSSPACFSHFVPPSTQHLKCNVKEIPRQHLKVQERCWEGCQA